MVASPVCLRLICIYWNNEETRFCFPIRVIPHRIYHFLTSKIGIFSVKYHIIYTNFSFSWKWNSETVFVLELLLLSFNLYGLIYLNKILFALKDQYFVMLEIIKTRLSFNFENFTSNWFSNIESALNVCKYMSDNRLLQ